MIVSIINTDNKTTLKFVFDNSEKNNLDLDYDFDFMHTTNVGIKNDEEFKEQIIKLLSNIEFKDVKKNSE